jgi:hypothetical protein
VNLSNSKPVLTVLHLSVDGINQIAHSVPLVEALADLDRFDGKGDDPADTEHRLANIRERATFAQNELDNGFPTLNSHAVVAIWGVIEAFVDDLVATYLENDAKFLDSPLLANIKIPLAEYEQLERPERLRFLVSEYRRGAKAEFKQGVSRFEVVLDLVGLTGSVEDSTRRHLFELSHVRNVLVHRAGIADRRLASQCDWLGLATGDKLKISHEQYCRYRGAIQAYMLELATRVLQSRGYPREQAEQRLRSKGMDDRSNSEA